MEQQARQVLCDHIQEFGASHAADIGKCEAVLRDVLAAHRREANVLILALRERVVQELLAISNGEPAPTLFHRLVGRLQHDWSLTEETAAWAVETWALAVDPTLESRLKRRPVSDRRSRSELRGLWAFGQVLLIILLCGAALFSYQDGVAKARARDAALRELESERKASADASVALAQASVELERARRQATEAEESARQATIGATTAHESVEREKSALAEAVRDAERARQAAAKDADAARLAAADAAAARVQIERRDEVIRTATLDAEAARGETEAVRREAEAAKAALKSTKATLKNTKAALQKANDAARRTVVDRRSETASATTAAASDEEPVRTEPEFDHRSSRPVPGRIEETDLMK